MVHLCLPDRRWFVRPSAEHPVLPVPCCCCCSRKDKERENSAALEVLPDLLAEIDEMAPPARLLALVQASGRARRAQRQAACQLM